ncbi:molybdenum cofactor guanylyltransferase [Pseudodesulfovibrio tunisiensis]|uniref:molybdenum cofactor guanylyltransferase n=1 Tax=Pseudodesulfovibrio tunisiensis TaxID=463192 RepID=UPI001FB1B89D|nr:molybdenum cofactor guanylyltransferase [Pseudodesulfovibrio tunisiensis]
MQMAGIILAGGLGSRMGNVRKAFLEIRGRRILDRLLDVYRPLFPEIVISAREAEPFADYGLPVALDAFAARSSLTGIHAGLARMTATHGFFAACDAPFLQPGLVSRLLEQVRPEDDVVVPLKTDGYREPLCAVYSRRCLPFIQDQLERGDYKIINFFPHVSVREVPVQLLQSGDPEFVSFINVNTPEELEQARSRAEDL